MPLWSRLKSLFRRTAEPEHLRRGRLGERAAKKHLQQRGLKFLTANFRSARGEIDLVFRDAECLLKLERKSCNNWKPRSCLWFARWNAAGMTGS